MKKKNLLKRVMPAMLAAAMLGGCAGGEAASTASEASGEAAAVSDPMAAYEEEVVITLGHLTGTNPRLPDGDTFEDNAYTRYLKQRLNITISDAFEANGDDYTRQVSLAMASGELPDIMLVNNWNDLQELAENDMIADLTTLYEQYGSDRLKEIYASYDDVFEGGAFGKATFDGKIYAMPDAQGDSGPNMVWVRQDWVDALELDLDADGDKCISRDELKTVAQAFIDQDPGGTGKPVGITVQPMPTSADNDGGSFTLTGLANSFGAFPKRWVKDASGEIVYGSVTAETKAFLTEMAAWYKEGILDPQCGTRTWDDCMSLMVNNQAGIVFGQWHMPDWAFNQIKTKNPECEFACYAVADENGKANSMHVAPLDRYLVVSAECEHPEALIKMMNIYFDEISGVDAADYMPDIEEAMQMDNSTKPVSGVEVQPSNQLLKGYEGVMKAVDDESYESQLEAFDKKMAQEIRSYLADSTAATVEEWSHYNSRANGLGLYHDLEAAGLLNWSVPAFSGSTDSMAMMWTNLDKLENEMVIKIITGAESPDAFDTFVQEWNAQGGEKITKEVRDQAGH